MPSHKRRKRPDLKSLRRTAQKVYRVQDSEGRGPWRPGFSSQWVGDRTEADLAALPPIMKDFPDLDRRLRPGYYVGVGCVSLEKLRQWITEDEWRRLYRFGYRCYEIVPARIAAESRTQCVFESTKHLSTVGRRVKLYS